MSLPPLVFRALPGNKRKVVRVIPTKPRTCLWLSGEAVLCCSTYTQDLGAHVLRTLMLFSKVDLCFMPFAVAL